MDRRSFLQLLIAAGVFPTVPASSRATAQSGAGAHPLGLNLTGISYWSSEYPFSNLAYNASRWRTQIKGAPFTWDTPLPPMTEDEYPKLIPDNAIMESFLIFTPKRDHLPVQLSVHYDGKGKMNYSGGAKLIGRQSGRDDIRDLRNGAAVTAQLIATDENDPIRNIRIYARGEEPKDEFRKPFTDRLRGMATLRFMDWMGTNNSRVRHWDDRPKVGQFGQAEQGVPLEPMVTLSNHVGSAPWFNMPHMADDDYIRRFAEQVRATLDPSLDVYVEYSNEVWNSMFDQADYARAKGLELGLSSNDFEAQLRYCAQRTSEVLRIWEDVFGDDKARVIGVYAAQSANDWTSSTILSWDGVADHADALAIAPYFGGGLGEPEKAQEVSTWPLDRLFETLTEEVEGDNLNVIRAQVSVARQFDVKLLAYEGGQHLVGFGGAENNDRLTELFIAANRDPRMGKLYKAHLENWWRAGGDIYAVFSSMSEPSKWGSWGLQEFEGDNHVKWETVQSFLRG